MLSERRTSETARYAVPVIAISGRGGLGKSTLALRVAHELGAHFPDRHLDVDLPRSGGAASPGPARGAGRGAG